MSTWPSHARSRSRAPHPPGPRRRGIAIALVAALAACQTGKDRRRATEPDAADGTPDDLMPDAVGARTPPPEIGVQPPDAATTMAPSAGRADADDARATTGAMPDGAARTDTAGMVTAGGAACGKEGGPVPTTCAVGSGGPIGDGTGSCNLADGRAVPITCAGFCRCFSETTPDGKIGNCHRYTAAMLEAECLSKCRRMPLALLCCRADLCSRANHGANSGSHEGVPGFYTGPRPSGSDNQHLFCRWSLGHTVAPTPEVPAHPACLGDPTMN